MFYRLSKRETKIYEAMKSAGPCVVWLPEDIAKLLWTGNRPRFWRQTVTGAMLLLCAKSQGAEFPVERIGGALQGRPVSYRINMRDRND